MYSRHIAQRIRVPFLSAVLATLTAAVPAVQAYEVWLTDQSDTGKESGGFLYIYDGAQLAANPSSATTCSVSRASRTERVRSMRNPTRVRNKAKQMA